MTRRTLILTGAALLLLSTLHSPLSAAPIGTAFSYQGRLSNGTEAANGLFDFSFAVFNQPSLGSQQGPTVSTNAVPVNNSLFAVTLDFGNVFSGTNPLQAAFVAPARDLFAPSAFVTRKGQASE
jgi:hypothetical protein